jgi:hypothetical protein
MTEQAHADENDQPTAPRSTNAYPGWLDQRLLTPSAPLGPGAAVRVIPAPLLGPRPSHPPTWAPDPTGRHQWRWWGGVAWTDLVADDGVASEDPLDPE